MEIDRDRAKGFFQELFDISFSGFVTPKIITVLFVIGIVLSGLGALAFIASGFRFGVIGGIIMLIIAPIVFLLYVIVARIYCELIMVLFALLRNVENISRHLSGPAGAGTPAAIDGRGVVHDPSSNAAKASAAKQPAPQRSAPEPAPTPAASPSSPSKSGWGGGGSSSGSGWS